MYPGPPRFITPVFQCSILQTSTPEYYIRKKLIAMAFLQLIDLTKHFGDVLAVQDVNLSVEEGTFFTFLGPSGCGKTTTLRMVAGFETPSVGRVIMGGKDITDRPPERRQIGMMFQNYALFPHMTVYENVAYGPRVRKMEHRNIKAHVEKYLALVGLAGFGNRKITQLSGGEQQRVALARSLATEPAILLLDEPLSNLDAKMRQEMRFELKRIQRELGVTMLYVTHDQGEALMMSDQIALFHKGQIQQIGKPQDVYAKPVNSFVAGFVGQTNLIKIAENRGTEVVLPGGMVLKVTNPVPKAQLVSLRNEFIEIIGEQRDDLPVHNTLAGQITNIQFNGMVTYYTVQLPGLSLEITSMNNGFTPVCALGDTVNVCIHPDHVVLLEV